MNVQENTEHQVGFFFFKSRLSVRSLTVGNVLFLFCKEEIERYILTNAHDAVRIMCYSLGNAIEIKAKESSLSSDVGLNNIGRGL